MKIQVAQKHKWAGLLTLTVDYLVLTKDFRTLGWGRGYSVPVLQNLGFLAHTDGLGTDRTYLFSKRKP